MPTAAAIPVFLASLVVMLGAARQLAQRLDALGVRFDFPEALIGLLTAAAADSPEVSSALIALAKGDHSVSVGVLVGASAFNFASMIGLSALLVGAVKLTRAALLLEGLVAVAVTLIAAAVLLRWLAVPIAVALAGLTIAAYLILVIGGYELLQHRAMPRRLADPLGRALASRPAHDRQNQPPSNPTHRLLGLIAVDLGLIVAGSFGLVHSATTLGGRWHISQAILGILVLGPLASLPNAFTGVRLGLAGRGAALVGETLNSNTINLAAGVIVPTLFASTVALSATGQLGLGWLVAMTFACLALLAAPGGLRRPGGVVLILLYCGFVAIQLA